MMDKYLLVCLSIKSRCQVYSLYVCWPYYTSAINIEFT